ncbi:B-cell receptor CD22-like isoform X1 [Triplophysa rosa]|uniref:B-cell receptor CD22-like isoform X1 n=1 Tax=Triplophysa rosa TaxID=992332 RepID=UPI002546080B|nr:B-cell receptor CD22-like isoform X1 [Triplophysa rosa]XP_057179830.1 B-cell receptor CD22-like isoform X1 [Triplophysa rosa]
MKTSQKIICIILFLKGVWCRDWNISLPEKIEALTGSCVTINCTFDINNTYDLDLNDTAVGIWFKNNHDASGTIMYNSSISNNLGKITGNLKDKDCTTDFYNVSSNHSAKFFFRIEGKGKLRWTYAQKYVSIHVIESPPNPTVKMFMGQMEVQEVLEGNAVNLRCSAITLCCSSSPPTLTWRSTDGLSLNENNRQQQQNQTEIISDLNFTASHLQHGVTFICNITYQLQNRNATAQSNITLRVLYAPKNTSVSVFPSDSVLEGASVSLTCRSDANPAVLNYTWFRENGGRLEQLQTGQNLTVNVTDRTHARYYCRAGNQHGTQNTSVLLDIQCAPKNTSVSVFPSDSVLEGTSVTLTCRSDANPAVLNYTWFRENRGRLEQLQTGQNLTVNVTDRTHTGRYYCRVENQYGTENTSVLLDIQCFNFSFVLIGVAVGVSMIVILCAITCICKRRGGAVQNRKPSQNRPEGTTRSISTNENEGESIYVNRDVLSSAGADTPNQQESLHYASITFTEHKTEPGESRRVSSLDTVYSVLKYSSAGMQKCTTDVSADVVTKQVKSKNSDEADELADSVSQLYAQVKRRNPRSTGD